MVLGMRLFGGGPVAELKVDSYESLKSETLEAQSSMDTMIERCQPDVPSVLQILSIGRASSSLVKKLQSLSDFTQKLTIKPLPVQEDANDYLLVLKSVRDKAEVIVTRMNTLYAPMEARGALKYVRADIQSINTSMRSIINEMKSVFPEQFHTEVGTIVEDISKALDQLLAKYGIEESEKQE
ncbi:uncharacterized protein FA14DRAFT_181636 [Meira miltonrushii]|uniref:Uncharacterized protein n=1 Tax=Meira miltonrushii TaxID=1280837 RepID=A0A316V5V2_9BASI|nr:uncharacterized protein FA14DRAFT_181636 [Meira miltonrushii]PWN32969.1 hypothetical protein FA14DRAFT_181636 [Meira miltonrushii]